jgi:hypothetical protein
MCFLVYHAKDLLYLREATLQLAAHHVVDLRKLCADDDDEWLNVH